MKHPMLAMVTKAKFDDADGIDLTFVTASKTGKIHLFMGGGHVASPELKETLRIVKLIQSGKSQTCFIHFSNEFEGEAEFLSKSL